MAYASQTTAFVFAGGGSLGAVQVGMLRELLNTGICADLVVGSSVGALNATYFAGAPHAIGVDKLEKIWRGLRPKGAIARALHALTLLIAHQMVRDLRQLAGKVDVFTVPTLCPLEASPYDFSRAELLIERAVENTRKWINDGGLSRPEIPNSLLPHSH